MAPPASHPRPLGATGIGVSSVAMGCWPIAGVTTLGATPEHGRATIAAALDAGVSHFDTAYVYGALGESERLLGEVLGNRHDVTIATKAGIHWQGTEMVTDGRPERLRQEVDESLRRLGRERIDLLYLHSPDPRVPLGESAAALAELLATGKARAVGTSNCTLSQTIEFAAHCPLAAVQLPYNLLQRDIERKTVPWCREQQVAVMVYWPLMKGLLAGRLSRDTPLDQRDKRRKYPMYQGAEWQRNQDFVDRLRTIAAAREITVAQLVVAWTIAQPGITAALCGAKRSEQIRETAAAMRVALTEADRAAIDAAIAERGTAEANRGFE